MYLYICLPTLRIKKEIIFFSFIFCFYLEGELINQGMCLLCTFLKGTTDIQAITDGSSSGMLTEDDRQACAEIMDGYLSGSVADPVAAGIEAGQIFNKLLIFLDIHVINSLLFFICYL